MVINFTFPSCVYKGVCEMSSEADHLDSPAVITSALRQGSFILHLFGLVGCVVKHNMSNDASNSVRKVAFN